MAALASLLACAGVGGLRPGGSDACQRLLEQPEERVVCLARQRLETRPDLVLQVLGDPLVRGRVRLRLAAPLLEAAPARVPAFTPAELEALAVAVVEGALDEGYSRYAVRVWMGLSPELRTALRERPLLSPAGWTPGADGGLVWSGPPFFLARRGELREALAVALAAAGQFEEARKVPVRAPGPLLRCLLGTRPGDPLELAMTLAPVGIPSTPQEEVAAALPCVAPEQPLLAWAASHLVTPELDPTLPSSLHTAQLEALEPLVEAVNQLRASAGTATPPDASLPRGWPRASPWRARRLPWSGGADCQPVAVLPVPGFLALEAQDCQGRRVTLAASRQFDAFIPCCWLLVGDEPPVFLGPLEGVVTSSLVPLLDGQGLVRLEVRLEAGGRQGPSVVHEAALAALRRDSDGDGLTDLEENVLLLDPESPDTDGDGIPDALDLTPRLDDRLPPTPAAEVLGVVLSGAWHAPEAASGPGPFEDRVMFVSATPFLAGLRPAGVVVQVTEQELEAGRPHFGWRRFRSFSLGLSLDGGHALVSSSDGIHGETARVDRQADGGWRTKTLFSWVW